MENSNINRNDESGEHNYRAEISQESTGQLGAKALDLLSSIDNTKLDDESYDDRMSSLKQKLAFNEKPTRSEIAWLFSTTIDPEEIGESSRDKIIELRKRYGLRAVLETGAEDVIRLNGKNFYLERTGVPADDKIQENDWLSCWDYIVDARAFANKHTDEELKNNDYIWDESEAQALSNIAVATAGDWERFLVQIPQDISQLITNISEHGRKLSDQEIGMALQYGAEITSLEQALDGRQILDSYSELKERGLMAEPWEVMRKIESQPQAPEGNTSAMPYISRFVNYSPQQIATLLEHGVTATELTRHATPSSIASYFEETDPKRDISLLLSRSLAEFMSRVDRIKNPVWLYLQNHKLNDLESTITKEQYDTRNMEFIEMTHEQHTALDVNEITDHFDLLAKHADPELLKFYLVSGHNDATAAEARGAKRPVIDHIKSRRVLTLTPNHPEHPFKIDKFLERTRELTTTDLTSALEKASRLDEGFTVDVGGDFEDTDGYWQTACLMNTYYEKGTDIATVRRAIGSSLGAVGYGNVFADIYAGQHDNKDMSADDLIARVTL